MKISQGPFFLRSVESRAILIHPRCHFFFALRGITHDVCMSFDVVRPKGHHPFFEGFTFCNMIAQIAL